MADMGKKKSGCVCTCTVRTIYDNRTKLNIDSALLNWNGSCERAFKDLRCQIANEQEKFILNIPDEESVYFFSDASTHAHFSNCHHFIWKYLSRTAQYCTLHLMPRLKYGQRCLLSTDVETLLANLTIYIRTDSDSSQCCTKPRRRLTGTWKAYPWFILLFKEIFLRLLCSQWARGGTANVCWPDGKWCI